MTLVELMIATAIGLILMVGIMQLYVSNKQTYSVTEALSRLQENGRFASHFLAKDIRISGFQGCRGRRNTLTITSNPPPDTILFNIDAALAGIDNSDGTEDLNGDGKKNDALKGTDVIQIQFGGTCNGLLTGNMSPANANIKLTLPNSCDLKKGGFFMISDCESADISTITNTPNSSGKFQTIIHGGNVNSPSKLSKIYSHDAEIFSLQSVSYYVAMDTATNSFPVLKRTNHATGITEELVEQVDDLQFEYGEDIDGTGVANRYLPAGSVTNMNDVVSVRMTLRVRTSDSNVSQTTTTLTWDDTKLIDKRIRRTFSSTIAIRNP